MFSGGGYCARWVPSVVSVKLKSRVANVVEGGKLRENEDKDTQTK